MLQRIAAALLVLATPAAALSQVVLPLEIADGGYLYVRARVAGDVEVRLLLDTGAGINTLSESVLRGLGTRARDAGTHTGTRHNGETSTGRVWQVPSLALGEFRKTDVVVGQFATQGADGLLSMDFFRDRPFTLDLAANRLTIDTPERLKQLATTALTIPIRLKPNGSHELDFFVKICVGDGVEADAEFDIGAGFNMLMLHPFCPKCTFVPRPPFVPRGSLSVSRKD